VTTSTGYRLIWFGTVVIGVIAAMLYWPTAFVDGQYVPVGNDSFYHARRIIDAAVGERGFYQFDEMIHIPEGSWLNWPWGYDYLASRALAAALWLSPGLQPMAFLAYIPVAWISVNAALFVSIARRIGLRPPLAAIAALGFAVLPLTQALHGLGAIDHHFLELTFVLATVLTGLRYFGSGTTADAIALGTVLGIAPAFHNGLFILQLPVLATAVFVWVSGASRPAAWRWLATILPAMTLVAALPSASLRMMQFEFWTQSWFHVYVAACSGLVIAWTGRRDFSPGNFALLVVGGVALAAPLLGNLAVGSAFLGGDIILLDNIAEVRSPLTWLASPGGVRQNATYYSFLVFVAPFIAMLLALRAWKRYTGANVFLAVMACFGIAMMLTQFRLHPYGSWALLIGGLLLLQELLDGQDVPETQQAMLAMLLLVAANVWSMPYTAAHRQPPGNSVDYAATRSLYPAFAESCRRHGGAALSYPDDGHYIRYHTDCSVMVNNFLMTPFHEQKVREAAALLQMSPGQLVQSAPYIDYVFVHLYGIFERGPDGLRPRPVQEIAARNAPLFVALTFATELPPEFELVDEVRVDDPRNFAYARIFRINRD